MAGSLGWRLREGCAAVVLAGGMAGPALAAPGCLGSCDAPEAASTAAISTLNAAAAVSSSRAWAVGTWSQTGSTYKSLIERWNGSRWKIQSSPSPGNDTNSLAGVAALSGHNVWAVGDFHTNGRSLKTLVEHWNGSRWRVQWSPSPVTGNNTLSAVAAVSRSNVWAVGYTLSTTGEEKTLIEHWNGSAWKVQHSPSPGGSAMLTAVAAVSGSNVWAVGVSDSADGTASKTLIEHWNGSGWKVASSPSPSVYLNNLCGVAAVSGSNVWAGGTLVGPRNGTEYQGPLMEHWNGQEWKVHASAYEPTGYEYAPCAIAAPTARSAWTVGSYWYYFADRTLIEHWNGTAWKVQKTPNPAPGNNDLNVLNGVAAASTSSAWAVGWSYVNNSGQRKPLIEHWNGSAWKLQYSPTPG